VAPDKAYRGMPPDVALAGAVCDALIWGKESWTADIQKQQEAPPPILMSSDNERIMAAYGWRDAEDIYEAAGLTERQRRAVALHLLGWEFAEIASEMRNSRWTVRTHVDVGTDKLHKLVHASSPIYIQGADRAE
jgi:DNA-binding NarL/FixJ family response regulator